MDLVSIEFESEFRLVRKNLNEIGARSVWTSGHICDESVSERCFTDEGVQPRSVNGWFWTGSNVKPIIIMHRVRRATSTR